MQAQSKLNDTSVRLPGGIRIVGHSWYAIPVATPTQELFERLTRARTGRNAILRIVRDGVRESLELDYRELTRKGQPITEGTFPGELRKQSYERYGQYKWWANISGTFRAGKFDLDSAGTSLQIHTSGSNYLRSAAY